MKDSKISTLSKILSAIAALLFIIAIFVPIWRIELSAPQYPEGLALILYSNKIAGDVDIINGLNHYIGMKTLHTEDFIEFKILPYFFSFFALLLVINIFVANKKILYSILIMFILFGVLSMVDFYRWNFDYGHDLSPDAAIKVPGMSYQPPLIGYKELLNFGAYSIPDIGGLLLVLAGLILMFASYKEFEFKKKGNLLSLTTLLIPMIPFLYSCSNDKPEAIKINEDKCDYCRMTIADSRFGTELITNKGRVYKFDDVSCLTGYIYENKTGQFKSYWVPEFNTPTNLINAETATYVYSPEVKSPMGGNIACFSDLKVANEFSEKINGKIMQWKDIQQND